MVIGTMGLEFGSGNKGCEALGFSFFYLLNQIAVEKKEMVDVKICMRCDTTRIINKLKCNNLRLSCVSMGRIMEISYKKKIFKECDLVYDFTSGDSFSDIYGLKRFLRWTMNKQAALWVRTSLILGSQTYGPYKSQFAKIWARHIIRHSDYVYARDDLSCEIAKMLSGRNDIYKTVDVAFALPYDKQQFQFPKNDKIRVGINPSGLLWAGGYKGNNQFSLRLDYKKYCIGLIRRLIRKNKYEIYLIPHVIYKDLSLADNDIVACNELKKKFSNTIYAPLFDTPMEAKGYISNMDIFIGARMHATIAAFTSGVATIPVSYSRKFEGLYNSLDYPYVISGTKIATEDAILETLQYVEDYKELEKIIKSRDGIIRKEVERLLDFMRKDIKM